MVIRLRQAIHAIWQDTIGVVHAFTPPLSLEQGLHTFRVRHDRGEQRIHLRVHADGAGTLFVDVTDVVHLNAAATELCGWALRNVALEQARRWLRQRYGSPAGTAPWETDLVEMYGFVATLRGGQEGCTSCQLPGAERRPLFSTPISAPYKADLALTYDCNNDCPHCYNEAERLALGLLGADAWRAMIDKLHHVGVPHLIFTGGEATMHPDLPELIRHADTLGHVCGLNSNGRRFSHAPYATELKQAGLNHVQITLGSHREEVHDRMMHAKAFRQTVRGIENCLAAGLHTITNTTLMQMNIDEIEETIDFLYRLGIRTFAMNGMIYSGGGFATPQAIPEAEMAPILIRVRDHARDLGMRFLWYTPTEYCRLSPVELDIGAKRCNAGEYSLCVEPNGDVLPCQSYYVAAGNMLRDPWSQIWHGELFESFRLRETDPQRYGLEEKCWECPDLPLCGGGCRIEREARNGTRVAEKSGCSGGCSGCGKSSAQAVAGPTVVGWDSVMPVASRSSSAQPIAISSNPSMKSVKRVSLRGTGQFDEGPLATNSYEQHNVNGLNNE